MCWFSGFETVVRSDVPLAELTWYRLGGPARWLCEPTDTQQLARIIQRLHERGIAWRVLGDGANVIVRDEGFDGVVIRLSQPAFMNTEFAGELVHVGGGVDFPKLIRAALRQGLVGLEVLAGIPGTMGGIVRMNAGGRYGEICQFVEQVTLVTETGEIITRAADQLDFAYRRSNIGRQIVASVTLKLAPGDATAALARHQEIWKEKYASQPPMAARTSGCIFKNPAESPAGRLIDEAGLKGTRVGGAEISTRHANFIVAQDGATAADVLNLMALAKERVRQATGIELEPEVEIW